MDREAILQLMEGKRLFEGAPSDVLGSLIDHGEVRAIPKGENLIVQGKTGEAVWVLLEGAVAIIENDTELIEVDKPGAVLGEISAVSHTSATATVRASSDLSALRISHEDFHKALAKSEKLATSVLRSLSKYLGSS